MALATAAGNAADLGGVGAASYARLDVPNAFAGTQTIANGNLDLPDTKGATTGVITFGGTPFIHECCYFEDIGYTNTFVGPSAGNFSTTGVSNTASGHEALYSNTSGSGNTASGDQALYSNTTGGSNTAIGGGALYSNTTGYSNMAIGGALPNNTTGYNNAAGGEYALLSNTTGNNNTASGVSALSFNTRGSNNTAVGSNAGSHLGNTTYLTTGSNSTFIGANATAGVNGLTNATAIGYSALVNESNALVLGNAARVGIGTGSPQYLLDVQGTGNFTGPVTFAAGQTFPGTGTITSVGSGAGLVGGPITTSGTLSIATAGVTNAMLSNPSVTVFAGTDLTGGGVFSLGGGTTLSLDTTKVPQLGTANTFTATQTISSGDLSVSNGNLDLPQTAAAGIGVINLGGSPFIHACCPNSSQNTFVGANAGNFTADANGNGENTSVGSQTLTGLTSGVNNTAIGVHALYTNTTGGNNTAAGWGALSSNTTGVQNTAAGQDALYLNTTGNENTAVGQGSLYSNTTGSNNTAIGGGLFWNTEGGSNIAIGGNALEENTTGSLNTAVGVQALGDNNTGSYNIAIGFDALYGSPKGNFNTAIGFEAGLGGTSLTNATVIGACAGVSTSNALVLGSPAGTCYGSTFPETNVGVDVASPSNIFTVLQGGGHAIADGWDTYSSRRWKSDIQPLQGALGKVELLRGVSYTYTANGKHDIGMIAEEVGKVVPEVVSYEENGKDARGIDYARLTALLVEAVKQQQSEIQQEKSQIRRLEAKVRRLEASKADAVQPVTKPAKTAAAKAGK